MTNGDEREIDTATLRAAAVTYRLMLGWTPKTIEVAEYCGIGIAGAWALLVRISDVVPIYQDREFENRWRLPGEGEVRGKRHYVITA